MIENSLLLATEIRRNSLRMVYQAKASHIGGALSMVDILSVLYSSILNYDSSIPDWELRDRFILSKGHSCVSFYSTLALCGFFPLEELDEYGKDGSRLLSHTTPLPFIVSAIITLGLPFKDSILLKALKSAWWSCPSI